MEVRIIKKVEVSRLDYTTMQALHNDLGAQLRTGAARSTNMPWAIHTDVETMVARVADPFESSAAHEVVQAAVTMALRNEIEEIDFTL